MLKNDIKYCKEKIREQEEVVRKWQDQLSECDRVLYALKKDEMDAKKQVNKCKNFRGQIEHQRCLALQELKRRQAHLRTLKQNRKFLERQHACIDKESK